MNRHLILIMILFFSIFSVKASSSESKDETIRIVTNNWTSQIVLSQVIGKVFKSIGYKIEYLPSSTSDQWGALAHGAAHVQVEVWEGTMSDMFNRMVEGGNMVDAGQHDAKTREDWWYPDYVNDVCPGLPDWKALKECAPLFATSDSNGKGVYFAGPWEKPDEARIRALDMDFVVNILSKGDDLWVELDKAFKEKRPIVLFNWTPNWVESRFEGAFVEFPVHAPECETDPSWGTSPTFLFYFGNPKGGWLKKAAWVGMEAKWSCAFKTLKNVNFNNNQIAVASALVDVDKLSYEDAAEKWYRDNQAVWVKWIPEECNP